MKKVSVKDFIIGALAAILFIMLLGAGYDDSAVGRYTLSATAAQEWGMVCVTDSLTGETQCKSDPALRPRTFSFKPKFK